MTCYASHTKILTGSAPALQVQPMIPQRVAMPIESLQHPLSVYDELLEVFA